jgi:hypothetical protein
MEECPPDDWHLGCGRNTDPDHDLCHHVLALYLASFHPYHRIHLQPVEFDIKKVSILQSINF